MPQPLLRGLGTLGVAAAVATGLGFLGEAWWGFDMLANFRMQYAAILIVAAASLAYTPWRPVAALLAVAAAANVWLLLPFFLGTPQPAAGDARLEIVTFNTQLLDPVVNMAWILDQDADVILLFESSRRAEAHLADLRTGYVVTSGIRTDRNYGVTVLSRQPIRLVNLPTSSAAGASVRFEVGLGDVDVAVYAVHVASPTSAQRTDDRNRDLEAIGRRIAGERMPVIVAGDLNSTPWTHGFALLAERADLVNSQRGNGIGATWPAHLWWPVRIPLDHVLHTDDLTVVEREVGPVTRSDHQPVRAVLAAAPTGDG